MKKYSIILPVRNGGSYIKDCIQSIFSQTEKNFDLVVLDNCSTDGTTEWLKTLKEENIFIYEAPRPLTIEENWARILDVPKNEFITLIGHDDILNSNFLQVIDKLISKYPEASLYHTHFNFIDSQGMEIRKSKPMAEIENAEQFLESFLLNRIDVMGTGYVMRSADYDSLGGIPDYPNLLFADFELWMNLTLKSEKVTSDENCFSFRIHQSTTTTSPDIKMHLAFERFVFYLNRLQKEYAHLDQVIRKYVLQFITIYCKGLSHRLLRTPMEKRNGLTVKIFLEKCKSYADLLVPGNHFSPEKKPSIRLAKYIDSSSFGRFLFLKFKRLYSRPVLK